MLGNSLRADVGDLEALEPPRGFGRGGGAKQALDWKAISNYVLLVGLFVAMVTMFRTLIQIILLSSVAGELTPLAPLIRGES